MSERLERALGRIASRAADRRQSEFHVLSNL
jgi:hypothetical protein